MNRPPTLAPRSGRPFPQGRCGRAATWSRALALLCWLAAVARDGLAQESRPASAAPTAASSSAPATSQPASAAADDAETAHSEITPEQIEKVLKEADEARLDEASKAEVTGICREALAEVNRARELVATADTYRERSNVTKIEQELAAIQAELARPSADLPVEITNETSLAEAEQTLIQAEALLQSSQAQLTELEHEQRDRSDRRIAIPELVTRAQARAAALPKSQFNRDQDSVIVQTAQRLLKRAREAAAHREVGTLQLELAMYDARSELLTARRDMAVRQVALADKLVAARRGVVQELRRRELERSAQEARQELERAAQADPLVAPILQQNASLADEKTNLSSESEELSARVREAETARVEKNRRLETLTDIVHKAGLTNSVGKLLREARGDLPNIAAYQREIARRTNQMAVAQVRNFELNALSDKLALVDDAVRRAAASLDPALSAEQRSRMEESIREALLGQKRFVEELKQLYTTHLERLTALNVQQTALIDVLNRYSAFIGENVLWIRSTDVLSTADLPRSSQALGRLFDRQAWRDILQTYWDDFLAAPVRWALVLLVLAAPLFFHRRMRRYLRETGDRAAKVNTDRFALTLGALLATLGMAASGPLTLLALAYPLLNSPLASGFVQAVGAGLGRAGVAALVLALYWQICRHRGLAEAHFRWRPKSCKVLKHSLSGVSFLIVPAAFLISYTDRLANESDQNSLGRLAFICAMLALMVLSWRVLRPRGGVLEGVLQRSRGGWIDRLRFVWFPAAVAIPVGFALAAAIGYYYTALQLERRVIVTLWLILTLVPLNSLVLRWLFVAARRIAIEQALKRRAAQAEERAADADGSQPVVVEEPEMNLVTINAHTRQLLRTGIAVALLAGAGLIWQDMLPALNFLRNITVYAQSVDAGGARSAPGQAPTASDSAPAAAALLVGKVITLADVALAVVVIVITILLAKNIPGLLEVAVLQRLPMEAAARYAISTICRYVISIVGIAVAFGELGIGWSKVQWLAAAITFGLGFGLQEIFANFVSGLILLFERPIRIGDVVTVGDVTGTVSRIRIRATTIVHADRKELIIPNKELIVGRVMNWTLSDNSLRLVISVGLTHGSDVALARRLLVKAAEDNPSVADDPRPQALFIGFGQSSLDVELRCFVDHLGDADLVRNELNFAIQKAFHDAAIEMAFPTREVHVRSLDGAAPPAGLASRPQAAPALEKSRPIDKKPVDTAR